MSGPITMSGYMGAITVGAPFVMDYGKRNVEELVRVSDVQPADDVCCKVRLDGTTFWMPEIEFRRRATPFVAATTPSQRLDAATVERCTQVANEYADGCKRAVREEDMTGESLAYTRGCLTGAMAVSTRIRALATEPHQHGGKGA